MITLNSTYNKLKNDFGKLEDAYKVVKKELDAKNANMQKYASANRGWETAHAKVSQELNKTKTTVAYLNKKLTHVEELVANLASSVGKPAGPKKVQTNCANVQDYIKGLRAGHQQLQADLSTQTRLVEEFSTENKALKEVRTERDALRAELQTKTNTCDYVEGEHDELEGKLEKALQEATALRLELLEKNKTIQELARTATEQSQKHTQLLLKRKRSSSEDGPNKRPAM